jgi:hypothetical protein
MVVYALIYGQNTAMKQENYKALEARIALLRRHL